MEKFVPTANIPPPQHPTRAPRKPLPDGAVDAHAHVFDDPGKGGLLSRTHFVPNECTVAQYRAMLAVLGCSRGVLVQPSVYGTDNSLLLGALGSGSSELRGVVIVEPDIPDEQLAAMHALGVRGVRINTASATPGLPIEAAADIARRIAPYGWHLQLFVDLQSEPNLIDKVADLPVNIVIDHLGKVPAAAGLESAAARRLLELARLPHCWFKLMGPYFVSTRAPDFADTDALVRALADEAPDRCVWGTDWPHPSARALMPNDGDLVDIFHRWFPEPELRSRIAVDNAHRLYGFPSRQETTTLTETNK